jgi:hypothetical protein
VPAQPYRDSFINTDEDWVYQPLNRHELFIQHTISNANLMLDIDGRRARDLEWELRAILSNKVDPSSLPYDAAHALGPQRLQQFRRNIENARAMERINADYERQKIVAIAREEGMRRARESMTVSPNMNVSAR